MSLIIQVKRIYEHIEDQDGIRILVDRLWPRGISKEKAKLDYWLKHIAPSTELRKEFHNNKNFNEFKKNYKQELNTGDALEAYNELKEIISSTKTTITLLYASIDETYNHAQIVKEM